jgi:hypothetical protein
VESNLNGEALLIMNFLLASIVKKKKERKKISTSYQKEEPPILREVTAFSAANVSSTLLTPDSFWTASSHRPTPAKL